MKGWILSAGLLACFGSATAGPVAEAANAAPPASAADTTSPSPDTGRTVGPDSLSGAADPAVPADSSSLQLPEKSVRARFSRPHREKEASRIRLDREALRQVAAAQGDPLKALATLPGTTNQNDLSVRPFVRGGKSEETQVLWEGIPLLQPYHFGSVYSVFNIESLRDLTLYSGGFPAEMGNALSGALFMRARPAPLDSLSLSADLSLLRGNAYAGVPIIKDRLGASFSYQAFWYGWTFNRGLDLVSLFRENDAGFQRDRKQIQTYLDLPNFKDMQLGLAWKIASGLDADYTGILSKDIFTVKEPQSHYYVNGDEISPDYYAWDLYYGDAGDKRERARELDTLAVVSVANTVHALALHWRPGGTWKVDQTLAYQSQDWRVGFFDKVDWYDSVTAGGAFAGHRLPPASDYLLAIRNRTYDWRLDAQGNPTEALNLRLGASVSRRSSDFETRLPRPIFEAVVNGNVDALDALGYFDAEGFLIRRSDPGTDPRADYLKQLPRLIRFDSRGSLSGDFPAAYVAGKYDFDPANRLDLGLRAEYDTYSARPFLSPRAAFYRSLGKNDEMTVATGLYSQADFPFQIRSLNPSLRSEKAFHFNLEWTHAFSDRYRLETELYQKNYFDLVTAYLVNTGHLEWGAGPLKDVDSAGYGKLPEEVQAQIIERFGDRKLAYRNGGTGKAAGAEVSFFYDPAKAWGGWLTAEVGYSKRQDQPGGQIYDYRYSRPWAFNWVNHVRLPNRYSLAVRGRFAAGLPYTDYVAYGEGGDAFGSGFSSPPGDPPNDTLFYAGPRNGKRYAPYSRWDLRVAREIPLGHGRHALEAYCELWNAFNAPNFLMSDSETRQWKFVDMNYPIPILFLGISGRW
jgi:hypothetical protein